MRYLVALALLVAAPAAAQESFDYREIEAPRQTGAIRLDTVPEGTADTEQWMVQNGVIGVRNVTVPTLTPVLPAGPSTGAAMIVAPGGAFLGLAIDHEGWQVARYLANNGIAAFVLKYRVLPTPADNEQFRIENDSIRNGGTASFRPPEDTPPQALADGLAALRHVRDHAAEYGIDPQRVGFMGFSAGGFLTRSVVEHGGDDAPDFAAPIYPSMAPMAVPADAPPLFVTIAADDFLLDMHPDMPLLRDYRAAGGSIEFHLLSAGGHGFGLGRAGEPSEGWPAQMLRWMGDVGMLEARNAE
ncbi:MAG: alpha/beta hydrolase [Erythrobacter sp.]|nr:MAG: alpha/beta hydrolase [Erythrobacter sp.]